MNWIERFHCIWIQTVAEFSLKMFPKYERWYQINKASLFFSWYEALVDASDAWKDFKWALLLNLKLGQAHITHTRIASKRTKHIYSNISITLIIEVDEKGEQVLN